MNERLLKGIQTSPGIALGEVFLFLHSKPVFNESVLLPKHRDAELARFESALIDTREQLLAMKNYLSNQAGEDVADIFEVQAFLLDDEMFVDQVRSSIRETGLNAEATVLQITETLRDSFASLEDERLRRQAQDIQDVGLRIIRCLLGSTDSEFKPLEKPVILVADDLLPSDAIHLLDNNIIAVATDFGGGTSHTAILTRALQVPAVVGLKNLTELVNAGDSIIVNGNSGKIIVHPTKHTSKIYTEKKHRYDEFISSLADIEKLPAETTDGHRIALRANLELTQELASIKAHGGEGVGLYRTEYLSLSQRSLPSEDYQFREYRKVLETLAPDAVTIRTFDLGGDKVFSSSSHPTEANPFMGWRAIRVSLDEPNILQTQLRAILRSAVFGKAKILIPFVAGLDEVRVVKKHLALAKEQLQDECITFDPNVPVGVMIELPSAVMLADKLAKEIDFFSIGTNDLTQFTLAVDRGNERVQKYYNPLHPAMIRMIRQTITAGHNNGIKVSVCGEFAANPLAAMLLVGLDIDELSVSPVALPQVKKLIRSMSYTEAKIFADRAFDCDTVDELHDYCLNTMKKRFAELPILFSGNGDN